MHTLPRRIDLLKLIPKQGVCVEVGTFRGKFSDCVLRYCLPNELHLVDGWETIKHLPADTNGELWDCRDDRMWASVHQFVREKYKADPRVTIHCGDSSIVLASLPDSFADFSFPAMPEPRCRKVSGFVYALMRQAVQSASTSAILR